MEPRFHSSKSTSPPFCSGEEKIMSLQDQTSIRFHGENGQEYTLIATPVSGAEGEVLHQAILQQVSDGQSDQVLMLQPITVTTVNGIELHDNIGQVLTDGEGIQIQADGHILQDGHIIQADGQILQADGQILQADGQIIQAEGHTILADGHVIQADEQVLEEGQVLSETSQAQIQALIQEASLASFSMANSGAISSASSVFYTTPESFVSSAGGSTTTQTVMLQTADGQSFQAQVSIPISQTIQDTKFANVVQPPVGKGPFGCELCSRVFTKWNQLQRHRREHNEDKPFRCPDCSMTFNVSDNLRLHVATHSTQNPQCPECGKKFSRVASLKAHIMLHEKEEFLMCPECGDEFALQSQLDRHLQEHREQEDGTRTYSCKQCTVSYTRMSLLREHMKQHYKIKTSLSHKTYKRNIDRSGFSHKCKDCNKSFQKPSQLTRHYRIHTGERPYKCSICNKDFNQKGALQIHQNKHTGSRPYPCQFCPATFSQKGNLRAHIQRLHSQSREGEGPMYHCDECSCVFRKLGSLNAHLSRFHSENIIGPEDQTLQLKAGTGAEGGQGAGAEGGAGAESAVDKNKVRHVKDVIQQLLELSDAVTDPQTTQQQLQQIAVTENISQDILQQALENSGLAVQTDTSGAPAQSSGDAARPAVLQVRPNLVSTMMVHDAATGTMKKHAIRKVNGIRWHQCTYCGKEFKKPSDLVRHIRIHTHEKPYKCTQCFRAFAVKSTLTAHMRTHSGVKDFRCIHCLKMFSTQGSLKVHTRLHTGTKPFKCPHCDKKFRTSGHRKSHVASHFKDPVTPRKIRRNSNKKAKLDANLPDIPLPEPILITDSGMIQQPPKHQFYTNYLGDGSSIDRPFRCHICSRAFKKSSHLKQHIRSHTGERPYKCIQCMRSFVSSGVLKAHIRTHSGVKAFKCLACDSTFTTAGSLKRHMSTHSEVRPFMCPYCQKTFKTSVNCKKHMKTHRTEIALHSLDQQTLLDKDGQPQEVALITEVEVAADDDDDDVDGGIQEAIEIQQGGDLTEQGGGTLTLQQDFQTADLQANVIQDALVSDVQLSSTINPQVFGSQGLTQNYTQSLLSNSNQTFNQLNYTIQTSTNNDLETSHTTVTPSTIVSTSIQNILQTKEPEPLVETLSEDVVAANQILRPRIELQETPSKRTRFACPKCDRVFKKSSHLKQHVRSHTGEKPFRCDQCSRTFVSNSVLKAHLKTHSATKDFQCPECQWTFTTKGSLNRHLLIHSSLKPFKCPYCNDTFRTAFHCKKHMRIHRDGAEGEGGEQTTPAHKRCRSVIQISDEQALQLCQTAQPPDEVTALSVKLLMESAAEKNRISEAKALEGDEDGGTDSSKHAHQCMYCNKSFKKPSDLTRHIRIHTGEKPFSCPTCGRAFTVKSTLDSHMRTHMTMEKRFKCHMCNSAFSTKGSLKVHMRLHTGAKPFKCPHCDMRFRTSGHRKSHIALHFKPMGVAGQSKKPKVRQSAEEAQSIMLAGQGLNPASQIITIDPSMLSGVLPIQLNVMDGSLTLTDSNLSALQGLDGLQLQVTANIGGQGIQITGLDPSILTQTQTVQIDASLLQQLQQQQAVNPNLISQSMQGEDSAQMQVGELGDVLQQPVSQGLSVNDVVEQSLEASETVVLQDSEDPEDQQQQVEDVLGDESLEPQEDSDEDEGEADMGEEVSEETLQTLQQAGISLVNPDGTPVSVSGTGENQIFLTPTSSGTLTTQIVNILPSRDADRTHICNKCGKSFKRSSHLREHMATHNPEAAGLRNKSTPHKCQTCQKAFRKPSQLERHIRIHTGERPYVCEVCNRAFNQKNALQIHQKKHTGERPHHCPYCTQKFTQKGNLKTHIKRAHHVEMVQSMNLPKSQALDTSALAEAALMESSEEQPTPEETADPATQEEGIDLEGVVRDLFTQ